LQPIYLTGTPQERDEEFFGLITTPLVETQKVFSNVESFEAQKAEVLKETADKKAEKEKAKKTKTESKQEGSEEEEEEEKVPVVKDVKVNHEKVLKDFMTSIKGQDILVHKEKLLQLLVNLSEAEADKPFPKKVKIDLDIAIRKKKNIDDARLKMGIPVKEETPSFPLDEKEVDAIGTVSPAPIEIESVSIGGGGGKAFNCSVCCSTTSANFSFVFSSCNAVILVLMFVLNKSISFWNTVLIFINSSSSNKFSSFPTVKLSKVLNGKLSRSVNNF